MYAISTSHQQMTRTQSLIIVVDGKMKYFSLVRAVECGCVAQVRQRRNGRARHGVASRSPQTNRRFAVPTYTIHVLFWYGRLRVASSPIAQRPNDTPQERNLRHFWYWAHDRGARAFGIQNVQVLSAGEEIALWNQNLIFLIKNS